MNNKKTMNMNLCVRDQKTGSELSDISPALSTRPDLESFTKSDSQHPFENSPPSTSEDAISFPKIPKRCARLALKALFHYNHLVFIFKY
jgi:hypothetical protein